MTRDFLTAQLNRLARTLRRKLDPAAVDEYLRVLSVYQERTLERAVDGILDGMTAEALLKFGFPSPGDLKLSCRAHEPFAEQARERPEPYRHLYDRLPAETVEALTGQPGRIPPGCLLHRVECAVSIGAQAARTIRAAGSVKAAAEIAHEAMRQMTAWRDRDMPGVGVSEARRREIQGQALKLRKETA